MGARIVSLRQTLRYISCATTTSTPLHTIPSDTSDVCGSYLMGRGCLFGKRAVRPSIGEHGRVYGILTRRAGTKLVLVRHSYLDACR